MNNSFALENSIEHLLDETPADNSERLRARETELIQIIEAITKIAESAEWLVLKEKIFDGVVDSLKKLRDVEVEKKPLNGPMIHSINGQLAWAKRYADFIKLADIYKLELINTRKKLNAT